ncbi:hypothetical protein DFO66_107124 [Brevibacterium sanguinis]|uniref:DUF1772 domain-containing protein n=2 Tax=Brevibacterium TaxID=1696 RepID=A0A366II23_9MICO|nr:MULTISPECIES: DUF1772 domain-containing protein [Brevibacterium]RBP64247.1 hypothetical protein DFO66_107124 [Brevibacterium sanguinis]RBP71461.1 hypothetical protein DFO65_10560 [Brevibacterium celere]
MSADTARTTRPTLLDRLRLPVVIAYLWVMMTLFGAIVLETLMIYPNVFADPPESLGLAMEFLAVTGPGDVFPPFGMACWILGAASLLLTIRVRGVRWWIALSLAALVAEGIVSMLFFWPRNDVMFVEGLAVHSAEHLIAVAREFETWHWISRMTFNSIGAASVFVGFLRLHRFRVLAAGV